MLFGLLGIDRCNSGWQIEQGLDPHSCTGGYGSCWSFLQIYCSSLVWQSQTECNRILTLSFWCNNACTTPPAGPTYMYFSKPHFVGRVPCFSSGSALYMCPLTDANAWRFAASDGDRFTEARIVKSTRGSRINRMNQVRESSQSLLTGWTDDKRGQILRARNPGSTTIHFASKFTSLFSKPRP